MSTRNLPKIALRLGTRKALVNEKKVLLEGAPFEKDGKVYLPVSALSGLFGHGNTVSHEGVEYTSEIVGAYVNADSTGLVLIDSDEGILSLNHNDDKDYFLNVQDTFIFDFERIKLKGDYSPCTEEQRAGFVRIGEQVLGMLNARAPKRPYLFTTKDIFDKLRAIYEGEDCLTKRAITKVLEQCIDISKKPEFRLNEKGDGLNEPLHHGYGEDLYDIGGRHYFSETIASCSMHLSFAYIITGNEYYARQAYFIAKAVCEMKHWGPGHFLNCAGAAGFFATAYDWMEDAWEGMGLDAGAIYRGVYRNGIYEGFLSFIFDTCTYPTHHHATGWRYKDKKDNWNSVNNSCLVISILSLITSKHATDEEKKIMTELLGACLTSITQPTYVLKLYMPDGSYVESNHYWSYGTESLFKIIAVLYDAIGSDLGISLSAGIDRTCYYALSSESCDFVGWNYHDGLLEQQDSSLFNMLATVNGDDKLYALRISHLERGKNPTLFELLYSPVVRERNIPKLDEMPLDYYMEGIDAFVVRNGWAAGSLYAGIMGGYNPVEPSHSQLDSGSLVYHNKGVLWFTDMGPDYYNVHRYFENYCLYRRNAEGNNTLCLPSVEYGQLPGATGRMTRVHSGKGAYAIIDNKEVYGDAVKSALRGMLITEDRNTVVIQDEVEFAYPQDAYGIFHFNNTEITATLAEDKKSATLTHKDGKSITVRLLGDGELALSDCYTYLLSTTANFDEEYDRHDHTRLLVVHKNATKIVCAVAIDGEGYSEIVPMERWGE